jgi:hypothetical protein
MLSFGKQGCHHRRVSVKASARILREPQHYTPFVLQVMNFTPYVIAGN